MLKPTFAAKLRKFSTIKVNFPKIIADLRLKVMPVALT
jgi:hypothetical protein